MLETICFLTLSDNQEYYNGNQRNAKGHLNHLNVLGTIGTIEMTQGIYMEARI